MPSVVSASTAEPTFYDIAIPTPADIPDTLCQLAQIGTRSGHLEVCWRKETKQVVIKTPGGWFIQPNGSVTVSLAALLGCSATQVVVRNLKLYEGGWTDQMADAETNVHFYECEWSDYANDYMRLDFNVDVDKTLNNSVQRLIKIIRALPVSQPDDDCTEMCDCVDCTDNRGCAFRSYQQS